MILSTMNRDELRKNIGQVFKFFPVPRRDSTIGSYESENNQWFLRRETPDKKSFEFLNMIGDYHPLVLDPLKIKNFDAPDILILRGQVILDGSIVHYELFHPKSASPSTPNTRLRLFLENIPDSGLIELSGPTIDSFRFWVTNSGKQPVRDYRVITLVPPAFQPPTYGSYQGTLTEQYDTKIGSQRHTAYEQPVSKPHTVK